MGSALEEVIKYRQLKDAERMAQEQAVPNAINAFVQAKQAREQMDLKRLETMGSLASKGLIVDPNSPSGFSRDASLEDPMQNLLKQSLINQRQAQTQAILPGGSNDEKQQDKLEKQYADMLTKKLASSRSGGLGLEDAKVNQAIHLRTLINQYYDPKTGNYNIPPAMHTELALGLARLSAPGGQVGIQLEEALRQKTGKEALANALIYMGADPKEVGGPTQSVIKTFIDSIDRQGKTSENLRNKYLEDFRKMAPSGLDKNRLSKLDSVELGNSFNDFLNNSNTEQSVGDLKVGGEFNGKKILAVRRKNG